MEDHRETVRICRLGSTPITQLASVICPSRAMGRWSEGSNQVVLICSEGTRELQHENQSVCSAGRGGESTGFLSISERMCDAANR